MTFDAHARAAREAAFATFARPVTVDPDGAARATQAIPSEADATEGWGSVTVAQRARRLRFRAEDAPAAGDVLALLDDAGAEVERRRVHGEPVLTGRRRLVADVDTTPV